MGDPKSRGVRVGTPKESLAARNDLTRIASHHHQRGDAILSRLSPTELRVKRGRTRLLYRVEGPLPR